jgi:hypothetical protein
LSDWTKSFSLATLNLSLSHNNELLEANLEAPPHPNTNSSQVSLYLYNVASFHTFMHKWVFLDPGDAVEHSHVLAWVLRSMRPKLDADKQPFIGLCFRKSYQFQSFKRFERLKNFK